MLAQRVACPAKRRMKWRGFTRKIFLREEAERDPFKLDYLRFGFKRSHSCKQFCGDSILARVGNFVSKNAFTQLRCDSIFS